MNRNTQNRVKAMAIAGKHFYGCMADPVKRQEGWRMMWAAKRACRRLGTTLQALGAWL